MDGRKTVTSTQTNQILRSNQPLQRDSPLNTTTNLHDDIIVLLGVT